MSFDFTDRRKHERVEVVQAIFIEVVSRGSRSEAENPVVRCETVDVSVGGLKIFIKEEIAAGSRLNLAVPMEDWKENLELVGEAMWVKPAEGKAGFWVGLELKDSSREDMEKWFKVVHTLSN
ncbi:MAG: PilZ domain-containing protein [Halioglobus sp.]